MNNNGLQIALEHLIKYKDWKVNVLLLTIKACIKHKKEASAELIA
jgi:hypothetical protein